MGVDVTDWLKSNVDTRDLHVYAGLVLLAAGLGALSLQWACIVVGGVLLYLVAWHGLVVAWVGR